MAPTQLGTQCPKSVTREFVPRPERLPGCLGLPFAHVRTTIHMQHLPGNVSVCFCFRSSVKTSSMFSLSQISLLKKRINSVGGNLVNSGIDRHLTTGQNYHPPDSSPQSRLSYIVTTAACTRTASLQSALRSQFPVLFSGNANKIASHLRSVRRRLLARIIIRMDVFKTKRSDRCHLGNIVTGLCPMEM